VKGSQAKSFTPKLDILPYSQRLLWQELDRTPHSFVLTEERLLLCASVTVSLSISTFSPMRRSIQARYFRACPISGTVA
jgi:hypothetical protein